jgi:hypothetical protein
MTPTAWAIVIVSAAYLFVIGLMVDDWLNDRRMNRND